VPWQVSVARGFLLAELFVRGPEGPRVFGWRPKGKPRAWRPTTGQAGGIRAARVRSGYGGGLKRIADVRASARRSSAGRADSRAENSAPGVCQRCGGCPRVRACGGGWSQLAQGSRVSVCRFGHAVSMRDQGPDK